MSQTSAEQLIMGEGGIDHRLRDHAETLIGATFTDMSLEELEELLRQMEEKPHTFNGVIDWLYVLNDYLNFRRSIEESEAGQEP